MPQSHTGKNYAVMIGGQLGVYPLLLLNRKVETNEKQMFDVQSMFSQMLYSIKQQKISSRVVMWDHLGQCLAQY